MEGKGDEDNVERGWKNRLNRWHDHGGLEIWHQIASCQCVRNLAWGHVTKQSAAAEELKAPPGNPGAALRGLCAIEAFGIAEESQARAEVAR